MGFVPDDFVVPTELIGDELRLEPLTAAHTVADYAAWMTSVDHILSTPGFVGRDWPDATLTLEQNTADLVEHDDDFAARKGFTYTVLRRADGLVVGCVYIYPSKDAGYDAEVSSWVRAVDADQDVVLHRMVSDWLASSWPFEHPRYADR